MERMGGVSSTNQYESRREGKRRVTLFLATRLSSSSVHAVDCAKTFHCRPFEKAQCSIDCIVTPGPTLSTQRGTAHLAEKESKANELVCAKKMNGRPTWKAALFFSLFLYPSLPAPAMKLHQAQLVALVVLLCVEWAHASTRSGGGVARVPMSSLKTLYFRDGAKTLARRGKSMPQLKCVGNSKHLCTTYGPDIIMCKSQGDGAWRVSLAKSRLR
jgi:hypothetical protein